MTQKWAETRRLWPRVPRAIKHQLTCLFKLASDSSLIGRIGSLVILKNHMDQPWHYQYVQVYCALQNAMALFNLRCFLIWWMYSYEGHILSKFSLLYVLSSLPTWVIPKNYLEQPWYYQYVQVYCALQNAMALFNLRYFLIWWMYSYESHIFSTCSLLYVLSSLSTWVIPKNHLDQLHIINMFKFIVHFRMPWLFYDASLSAKCIRTRILSFQVFTFLYVLSSLPTCVCVCVCGGGGGGVATIKLLAATLKPLELGFLNFVPFCLTFWTQYGRILPKSVHKVSCCSHFQTRGHEKLEIWKFFSLLKIAWTRRGYNFGSTKPFLNIEKWFWYQ